MLIEPTSRITEELSTRVREFESMFQEWLIFTEGQKAQIQLLAKYTMKITKDDFFRVNGDPVTPTEKRLQKFTKKQTILGSMW